MSPTILRRCLLTGFVLATVLIVLYGCAGEAIHGYRWVHDGTMPACERLEWIVASRQRVEHFCPGIGAEACTVGCTAYSVFDEATARRVDTWGESLYAHEERHALMQMRHPIN